MSADAGLLVLSLTVEALQGKRCQDSLLSGGGRSVRAKILGGRGHPWGIFFGFYKTRHILLPDSANCTVLRAVVLTQYQRVTDGRTDGQTDGIAVASTALAMRALRRAVKTRVPGVSYDVYVIIRLTVYVEHRLSCDRWTDGQTRDAS